MAGCTGPHGPRGPLNLILSAVRSHWGVLCGKCVAWLLCGEQSWGRGERRQNFLVDWVWGARKGATDDKPEALSLSTQKSGQSGLLESESCR